MPEDDRDRKHRGREAKKLAGCRANYLTLDFLFGPSPPANARWRPVPLRKGFLPQAANCPLFSNWPAYLAPLQVRSAAWMLTRRSVPAQDHFVPMHHRYDFPRMNSRPAETAGDW